MCQDGVRRRVLDFNNDNVESDALVNTGHTNILTLLLYCCCYCSAYGGYVVAFVIPKKGEFVRIVVLPPKHLIPPSLKSGSFLLHRSSGTTTHTRTHKVRRPWPSQKEELDERLLLFRGCPTVESAGDGAIRQNTAAAATNQRQTKIIEVVGVSIVLLGSSGSE